MIKLRTERPECLTIFGLGFKPHETTDREIQGEV